MPTYTCHYGYQYSDENYWKDKNKINHSGFLEMISHQKAQVNHRTARSDNLFCQSN